jgi:deoxycytidine triphosphate deaminase
MLIIGENLKSLIEQHEIVESSTNCFDDNCLSLSLDPCFIEVNPPSHDSIITYGSKIPQEWISEKFIDMNEGYILEPKSAVLACSNEYVKIPRGYFGLLQTKGSLARLFVTIHCCDGQIEPGFEGKITFEICNLSNTRVRLLPTQKVGSLFIFKASTRASKLYKGRYYGSNKPTIQKPSTK